MRLKQLDSEVQKMANKEMDQLYTTSQVSNKSRKTKFSHNSWHGLQDSVKKCKEKKQKTHKYPIFSLYCKIMTIINN